MAFLHELQLFEKDNLYRPHFIAFDKWERDNWDQSLQEAGVNSGYLYNAPAWQVYFSFIKNISHAFNNLPVMLFQIPGGHMQVKNDRDTRNDHGSTAPDYIFGDDSLASDLSNVEDYITRTRFKRPMNDYFVADNSVIKYLNTCPKNNKGCAQGVYHWHLSHWQDLLDMNVFSILWGGGSTTSIVGLTESLDDNGWLFNKLQTQEAVFR